MIRRRDDRFAGILRSRLRLAAACLAAFAAAGQARGEGPEVRLSARVELGEDLGQELGTLFEARGADGKVAIGAGFLAAENTMHRADRRQLQVYIKTTDGTRFETSSLPRPSEDAGVYAFGFDGRLYADRRTGHTDDAHYAWDPRKGAWEVDRSADKGAVRIGEGVMKEAPGGIAYDDQVILAPPDGIGTLVEPYYGAGTLVVRRRGEGKDGTPINELAAFAWKPGQPPLDWAAGKVQALGSPKEFIYVYGQVRGRIFTTTNMGGTFAFDGGAWKMLRETTPKTSFQIYAALNFRDTLLLGQYPTGELFEFDGEELRRRPDWPPAMPGVRREAREAQTLALYGGDLYVGVWPWGEVWCLDPDAGEWAFLGRMFTHPTPSDAVVHPYEAETKALDPVLNRWGQRVTGLVPLGDSLYISTSAKSSAPYEEKFTFLAGDKWKEYGAVHRYRRPGCLSVPFRWKPGPTTFEVSWTAGELKVSQDGELLGTVPAPKPPQAPAKVAWGEGIFGPFGGRIAENKVDSIASAAPAMREAPILAAYVDIAKVVDAKAPEAEQRRAISAMVGRLADAGFNAAYPYANTSSWSANYPSRIVTRRSGPDWDALGAFMEEAKRRGVSAWPAICVLSSGHFEPRGILEDHPEWAIRQPDGKPLGFLSPAHPGARAWIESALVEIVERYQPDGLLLDYLRYFNRPWQLDEAAAAQLDRDVAALGDVDEATRARFRQARGEEHITAFLGSLRAKLDAAKPGIKLGIYTWGPHVSRDHRVAQPWPAWVERGLIDHVNVSGYYYREQNGGAFFDTYRKRLSEAIALAGSPRRVPVTVAVGIETSHGSIRSAAEIDAYLRAAEAAGVDGAAMFTWATLEPHLGGLRDLGSIPRFAEAVSGEHPPAAAKP